ncbi:prephenate dehydrogenase [Rossellomorea sp. RS05]|uniref:prephenate dehydrogenase n=1 Tax=Rossellomorea sp. RS05 TaxID=3149166 RepID=UPI003221BCDE
MKGNVVVIGLGLIGGSLALCIKNQHPEARVAGFDVQEKEMKLGLSLGIIDEAVESLKDAVKSADLIIISTPVFQTEKLLETFRDFNLKPTVIITDTGSTKAQIMDRAERILPDKWCFIGGHPMAGSHKSGVTAAKDFLFENAFYMLTPGKGHSEERIDELKEWLKGTQAKFIVIDPKEHDAVTGTISHFPHIVAASLVQQAKRHAEDHPYVRRLAAGGFRDITRIASSSPVMWKDITMQNREVLLAQLDQWNEEMKAVIDMIEENDPEVIASYFEEAKSFRDELPMLSKGAIPSFYDLFVDVPDYPGVISEITGYLAEEEISLTNIRIMETREDIYGVLVISFQTSQDREKAMKCLTNKTGYELFLG